MRYIICIFVILIFQSLVLVCSQIFLVIFAAASSFFIYIVSLIMFYTICGIILYKILKKLLLSDIKKLTFPIIIISVLHIFLPFFVLFGEMDIHIPFFAEYVIFAMIFFPAPLLLFGFSLINIPLSIIVPFTTLFLEKRKNKIVADKVLDNLTKKKVFE